MKTFLSCILGAALVTSLILLMVPADSRAGDVGDTAAIDSMTAVTLEELLSEAAQSHPAILSARAQVDADAERPSQMGSLPDPVIGVVASNFRLDNLSLDSTPAAGLEFRFRQGIPFPGKLGRRRTLAEAEADVSRKIAREIASDIRSRVKTRYWRLSGAEAVEEITRDNLAVLEELINVAISRFAVGIGAQQDVLQAQAALAELEAQLIQREQETRNAQRELNVAVGHPADAPPIRTSRFALVEPDFIEADLARTANDLNPELGIRVARVMAAESSLEEALKDRWPDFAIGGGYRYRQVIDNGVSDGGDLVFISFDMSIPLYAGSKQNRRVAETKARLVSARHAETDLRLQIGSITRNLADESRRVLVQARQFRDEVVPQDRLAFDAAVSDYSVGRVEFVTIINNWQALLRDEIALERLTATLGVRRAELEFMVGRKFQ